MRALIFRPKMTKPSEMVSMKDYFEFQGLKYDLTEGNGGEIKTVDLPNDEILLYNSNPKTRDSSKNEVANDFLQNILPENNNDLKIYGTCIVISKSLIR